MSPGELEAVARLLDGVRREAETALAVLVQRVDEACAFVADGHRTVKAWGRAACNWSGGEAAGFARVGRMFAKLPAAAGAAGRGELGVAQLHVLARVVANPRVGEHLAAGEAELVGQASLLDFDDYVLFLQRWAAAADADGAHRDHDRAHRERRAHLNIAGERMYLDAMGGTAVGVELKEILDAFAHSEFLADWDQGVAAHGEAMATHLMERTDPQRRFDALQAIFIAAAGARGSESGDPGPAPTVNLVVGFDLFNHHLQRLLGSDPAPLDPNDPLHRCQTADGVVVDPYDAIVAAAMGHVRRVVLDSAGVAVDVGRKQRLFTGALREAVMLASHRCVWPGCYQPASKCEADHVLPWGTAGPTATHNGAPTCGHHNRWRTRGYRTWRDPTGQWHHYRPDNTEIGWRTPQRNGKAS